VKSKIIEGEIESEKPQSEKAIGDSEKPIVPTPYKPKIPFPQRLVKSNLDAQFKVCRHAKKNIHQCSFY